MPCYVCKDLELTEEYKFTQFESIIILSYQLQTIITSDSVQGNSAGCPNYQHTAYLYDCLCLRSSILLNETVHENTKPTEDYRSLLGSCCHRKHNYLPCSKGISKKKKNIKKNLCFAKRVTCQNGIIALMLKVEEEEEEGIYSILEDNPRN